MEKLDFMKYTGSLSHLAFNSANSRRRYRTDDETRFYGSVFDPFQLDIQKLISSKSFRRLADKMQVFLPRQHSNIRNRLIHTNDVYSVCLLVADIVGLNRNLAGAIAYGHDIGHTPYGHLGERLISKISGRPFSHAVMSVVLAQKIERAGQGLNLTYEVLEGMLYHTRGAQGMAVSNNVSQEASLVMFADKIAYTFADINDAIRLGYLKGDSIPEDLFSIFGRNQRERVARTIFALIKESAEKGRISFLDSEVAQAFSALRNFMYETIYLPLNGLWERECLFNQLSEIDNFFSHLPELKDIDRFLALALLTDSEAEALKSENRAGGFLSDEDKRMFGFLEIINRLGNGSEIDIFKADLHKKDFKFK